VAEKIYTVAVTTRKHIENFLNDNIKANTENIYKLKGLLFLVAGSVGKLCVK